MRKEVMIVLCSIENCGEVTFSRKLEPRGLCRHHHHCLRRFGDARAGHRAMFDLLVDKSAGETNCWLWTGGDHPTGYGIFHSHRAHRLAYAWANGPIPNGMEVDHICLVRRCVNPRHMRLVTRKQNQENRAGAMSNSKTGVRGVVQIGRRFRATIRHNGKDIYIGMFATPEEAGEAARLKRLEVFTHNEIDRVAI